MIFLENIHANVELQSYDLCLLPRFFGGLFNLNSFEMHEKKEEF